MALTFPVYSICLPWGFLNVKDSFVLKNLLIWHLAGDIDIDTAPPNNVWQMSQVSEQAAPYMGSPGPAMAILLSAFLLSPFYSRDDAWDGYHAFKYSPFP